MNKTKVLLEMELDGLPPTVNHLYRSMKNGRRYKTASGRDYQESVSALMREQIKNKEAPSILPLELEIVFHTSNRRRWDIDNRVKALQDCLTMAGVLKDDSQIDDLHVSRTKGDKTTTYIRVAEIE